MSLQNLAKELQQKGRGGDKVLVHMTPQEVSGLQAIARAHGGSLTVNPDTGLVEANFLRQILPMVAGAALSPFLTPMGAAAVVGGVTGLATGSVEQGLMSGLGAYGGAGLTSGLTSAGSSSLATPEAVAGQLGTPAATTQGSQAAMLAEQNAGFGVQGLEGIRSAASTATPITPQFDGSVLAGQPIGSSAQAALPTTGQQISAGVKAGPSAVYNAMPTGTLPSLAAPVTAAAMEPKPYQEPEVEYSKNALSLSPDFQGYVPARPNPYYKPVGLGYAEGGEIDGYFGGGGVEGLGGMVGKIFGKLKNKNQALELSPDFKAAFVEQPTNYYKPTGLGYAMGGQVDPLEQMAPGGLAAIQGARDAYGAQQTVDGNIPQFNQGGVPKKPAKAAITGARNLASMDPYEAAMAELNNARAGANMSKMTMPKGGIAELGSLPYAAGGMAGGRYLSGRGDGMSDDIPATINNRQPARLADGEFVVPADVVSHIGNGSSNAGAKKLYGMMDKVRTARTGKKKQAPAVKTDRYLPA